MHDPSIEEKINEINKGVINDAPHFVKDGLIFLSLAGSHAYGTNNEQSDEDFVGVTIPPPHILNPYTDKYYGFDEVTPFLQWKPTNDIYVYNITKFFKLASQSNPNVLELFYYPDDCVLTASDKWGRIQDYHYLFLSKEIYRRFLGCARSSINRLLSNKKTSSKRLDLHRKFGYDTKDAAQAVRVLYACQELLLDEWLDLRQHSEMVADIKKGEWKYEDFITLSSKLMDECDDALKDTRLPDKPRMNEIRQLLKDIIDGH